MGTSRAWERSAEGADNGGRRDHRRRSVDTQSVAIGDLIVLGSLAVLAFVLSTCTLTTLAAHLKGQKFRHTLIVESRRRRHEYLASLEEPTGEPGDFDVVEDEPPAKAAA